MIALLSGQTSSAPCERADWTVIAVLSRACVDGLHRFSSVGASTRVQVLVLPDIRASTSVHRVLPDQDSSHAPGDCDPSGGTCCDRVLLSSVAKVRRRLGFGAAAPIERRPALPAPSGLKILLQRSIPVAELSLTESSRSSEERGGQHLSYAQLHFPAHHHLFATRGHAFESLVSISRGGGQVAVPQPSDLLAHFAARRRGKKLEALNPGMCQAASTNRHVLAG